MFSSFYLGDRMLGGKKVKASKVFEKCHQNMVISLAKRYHPDVDDNMDEVEILSQLFLEQYAQELALKGPLELSLNGQELCLSHFVYGTVLNNQTLKHSTLSDRQRIKKVMTIENKASYEAIPYQQDTLYVYCHGFFAPAEREFLKKLYQVLQKQQVEYYHYGDMDYGGICIFRYIRKQIFPDLMPFRMDVCQYERYQRFAEPLETENLEKLKGLKEPRLQPLIDRILQEGKGIEQEVFYFPLLESIEDKRSKGD